MQQWLKEVARGKRGSKDLSYEETLEAAKAIRDGAATDAQIAAFFIAERMKTESPMELLAIIHAFQETAQQLTLNPRLEGRIIDFAGPYNGRHSFFATIPVSLLLADYGLPCFLHGSGALPPKYGTPLKDVLEEMGIRVDQSSEAVAGSLEKVGIGFAWTEKFSPILTQLRPIREQIGVRTLLNTVEKLLNLSDASTLMMGAFHKTAINKMEPLLSHLSFKNVFIVQGQEGSEDLPVHRNSFVYQFTQGSLDSFIARPDNYGLLCKDFDKEEWLSAKEQKAIIFALLNGETSSELEYYYNQVIFNAGIRYYLFEATASIEDGIEVAKEQLKNRNGLDRLEKWKASNFI